MNCEEAKPLIAARWAGETSQLLEKHLDECAECQLEAVELGALWTQLDTLPIPEPSADLRHRWKSPAASKPRFAWWPTNPAWQIGFVAAALALGVFAGLNWQKGATESSEIAQLRKDVAGTREMVALSLLKENTASERLKGVDYSGRMSRLEPEVVAALVQAVTSDSNVNVRLAAIDALARASGDSKVRASLVNSLSTQDSPMVQAALIDYAIDAKDKQATGALRRLTAATQLDPTVRKRADQALQILSQ